MLMIVGVVMVIVGVAMVIVGVDGRSVMILISLIIFMDTVHTNLYGHSSPRLHSPFTQKEQICGLFLL